MKGGKRTEHGVLLVLAVAFSAGIYLGLTRQQYPWAETADGVFSIAFPVFMALFFLFNGERGRRVQRRVVAAALLVSAGSHFAPNDTAQVTILGAALVVMLAAVVSIPRSLFSGSPERPG